MHRSALFSIFTLVFIDLLGFGIVIPILPYYVASFGASASTVGLLMAAYSAMQLVFSPFWGRLSDRIGRRPVLLTCTIGLALSMGILGAAPSLLWLFVGRLLAGFFGANISAASAYIADVTSPENRAKGMGLIGAAFGLGFLFGPAIGGLASHWGYGTAAWIACGLSVINFIVAFLRLPEPKLSEEERRAHRHRLSVGDWLRTITDKHTGAPMWLFFIATMGIAQLETSFGLFLLGRFGLDAQHAGLILAAMAVVMVLIQGGGIGKLAKKFGEARLVSAGTLFMAIALWLAPYQMTLTLFIPCLLLQAVGYAITNPSLMSLTSRSAGAGSQGATMGVYQSAGSLARIMGPLLAGLLFDQFGMTTPFTVSAGMFLIACVMSVVLLSPSSRRAACVAKA